MSLVLKHYTKLKPIACKALSGDINKLITVRLDGVQHRDMAILKGDPVILGMLGYNDEPLIYGGRVIAINPRKDSFLICSKRADAQAEELRRREFFRYPASLIADVKPAGLGKWEDACIIDISYSGMRIYSAGKFEVDSIIELNVFSGNSILKFDAMISRKTKNFNRNEYGIQIINEDKNNIYATQNKIFKILRAETSLMYSCLLDF
ncbi:PilZ domain-containing protein [Ruminiclostridium sufflavum DSM 19573]|uniref:PilZ domain-containing protein n=1 Tax=Ruminiclostridium sufflavum DSM 19573 TaxID=1121337 RepID=A0A318XH09_9FIRM|nr:PilZ domain-containing protein [Ruminiclostridium sufflavum]PYG85855.1 PilZ domain-containing protein [Ruminiclostridium sufflavum DSM 19573]